MEIYFKMDEKNSEYIATKARRRENCWIKEWMTERTRDRENIWNEINCEWSSKQRIKFIDSKSKMAWYWFAQTDTRVYFFLSHNRCSFVELWQFDLSSGTHTCVVVHFRWLIRSQKRQTQLGVLMDINWTIARNVRTSAQRTRRM